MSTDAPAEPFTEDDGVLYEEDVTPQPGILGFTLRELLIVAVWIIVFVTSFFPLGWAPTLWAQGVAWILPLAVPTAAVFLIVLRRFSPEGIRRVGSLGIDQFASVAFSVAAVWWAQLLWEYISSMVATGVSIVVWVPWVQLIGMLALVALTVVAPIIPGLCDDFQGRLVTLAHRNANPARPVVARPRPERQTAPVVDVAPVVETESDVEAPIFAEAPAFAEAPPLAEAPPAFAAEYSDENVTDEIAHLGFGDSVPLTSHASGGELGTVADVDESDYVPGYARSSRSHVDADVVDDLDIDDDFDVDQTAPRDPAVAQEQAQPFWALAPTERDVLDERGAPLFRIGPNAWALVIEDRGGAYVVRHDDGRIGYLHDVTDITKG